jgi:putative ABC transport system permease protein
VDFSEVGAGYFATMGIPLVKGREFTAADKESAAPVAVVNQLMAAKYWHDRSPIGSRLEVKGHWVRVVGVSKMSKYRNLSETQKPFFYVALRQAGNGMNLVIRTSLTPEVMTKVLLREVRAADSSLVPGEVITMQEQVDRTTAVQRVSGTMLAAFAGLALLLAAIGLYGVMSYTVSQSTRELALRMALGATTSNVLKLVLSRALAFTAAGIALGAAAALILSRMMGSLLYNVNPRDPSAFGSALGIISIAALASCLLPARRAARTDPVNAFRH